MNVVVIMLDSLRPDHVGCYGNAEVKTPYIDAVAAKGAVLESTYAEYPITVASRTALVSGSFTWPNRPWCPLRSYDMHLAEVLKKHGYATAAFSDTPFSVGAGMGRGFDTFESESEFRGVSALPLLRGQVETIRERAYIGAFNLRGAIRTDEWKFIDNRGEKPNELFHMVDDPQERTNLVQQELSLARELHRTLWEFQTIWSGALSWRDEPAGQ